MSYMNDIVNRILSSGTDAFASLFDVEIKPKTSQIPALVDSSFTIRVTNLRFDFPKPAHYHISYLESSIQRIGSSFENIPADLSLTVRVDGNFAYFARTFALFEQQGESLSKQTIDSSKPYLLFDIIVPIAKVSQLAEFGFTVFGDLLPNGIYKGNLIEVSPSERSSRLYDFVFKSCFLKTIEPLDLSRSDSKPLTIDLIFSIGRFYSGNSLTDDPHREYLGIQDLNLT